MGTLVKESHTGKLVDDWNSAVAGASRQPELTDMSPAVSTLMAIKDDDELVRTNGSHTAPLADVAQKVIRTAAALTSTLMAHYVALKLETILDRETKITHEHFAAQIEGRLGSGDKGPDMKVWDKGKGLSQVRPADLPLIDMRKSTEPFRLIGQWQSSATPPSSSPSPRARDMTSGLVPSPALMIWRIRACSWPQPACGIKATARIWAAVSL